MGRADHQHWTNGRGFKRRFWFDRTMSASLIGRPGSSAFRLPPLQSSMSLAGSRFSTDSALGPFHHGIRRQGGTILPSALLSCDSRFKRTCELTSSIVPRRTSFRLPAELRSEKLHIQGELRDRGCRQSLVGPTKHRAVDPNAMHDDRQPASQSNDCFF